ncbi:hypothetical protein [Xanthovirga aplysinae]|uniref:hypothetical protein n=1 Tax=Xanthovirga aplysinae TaxID=2529853 RepID=UPI0012BCB713|nr:hypothetical protein [Xanthovirga aplysinae]MTI31367.1 hypothetical protein [Xanthovirga aplysinae]
MKLTPLVVILFTILILTALLQKKGIRISRTSTHYEENGNQSQYSKSFLYLENKQLKIDIVGRQLNQSIIFRGDEQKIWFLDHFRKTYFSLSRKEAEVLKFTRFNKQFTTPGIKNITDPLLLSKPLNPIFVTHDQVNGWPCQKYNLNDNKGLISELWAADLGSIGLSPENLSLIQELDNFILALGPSSNYKIPKFTFQNQQGFNGFTIKSTSYLDGKIASIHKLDKVEKMKFHEDIFQIPNYREEKNLENN